MKQENETHTEKEPKLTSLEYETWHQMEHIWRKNGVDSRYLTICFKVIKNILAKIIDNRHCVKHAGRELKTAGMTPSQLIPFPSPKGKKQMTNSIHIDTLDYAWPLLPHEQVVL